MKPRIVAVDVETTGMDVTRDRIVSMCGIECTWPDLEREAEWDFKFNPGVPIPPSASARHGLCDEDVAGELPFVKRAAWIQGRLQDAVIVAYNAPHDIGILHYELVRAGQMGLPAAMPAIDPYQIFQRDLPRTLTGAVRYYLRRNHEEAHNARADAQAVLDVLRHQLLRHSHREVLQDAYNRTYLDHTGHFVRDEKGIVRFGFGRYRGLPATEHPNYLRWVLNADFPEATKELARKLMQDAPSEARGSSAA